MVKPELFPIIDRDGMAKPALLINVEQMIDAGIEEIFVIVQEEDMASVKRLFNEELSIENSHKLGDAAKAYANKILQVNCAALSND